MFSKSNHRLSVPNVLTCSILFLSIILLGACTPAATQSPTATLEPTPPPTNTPQPPTPTGETPKTKRPTKTITPTPSIEDLVERYKFGWKMAAAIPSGVVQLMVITPQTLRAVLMYMFETHASETSWIHEDFNVNFEDEIIIMDWGNDKIMRFSPRISDDGELSLKYHEPSTKDPFVTDMILSMLKGAVDDPSNTEGKELIFVRSRFTDVDLLLNFDLVQ